MTIAKSTAEYFVSMARRLRSNSGGIPKINPKGLGYVCPGGKINFLTEKSADLYIKHRLLDSLKCPKEKQFERLIVKRDNTIIAEVKGSNGEVRVSEIPEVSERCNSNVPRDIEIWHSHPDEFGKGRTTPLSAPGIVGDMEVFFQSKLKKVVAMNSNGEINSMQISHDFTPEKFMKFRQDYIISFGRIILPNGKFERLSELSAYIRTLCENDQAIPPIIELEWRNLFNIFQKRAKEFESTEALAIFNHVFYTKAPHYGMEYFTDFSNLRGQAWCY